MEEKELKQFSWTGLFLVTGICFLIFSIAMRILEGQTVPFFTWIGIACMLLGSLNGIGTFIMRAEHKKEESI